MTKKDKISPELREAVYQRDSYICRYCGDDKGPFHCDHVYPEIYGGKTIIENLVTACRTCNLKKSTRIGIWPLPLDTAGQIQPAMRSAARKMSIDANIFNAPVYTIFLGSLTSITLSAIFWGAAFIVFKGHTSEIMNGTNFGIMLFTPLIATWIIRIVIMYAHDRAVDAIAKGAAEVINTWVR